jgi:hypothetical protein
MGTANFSKVFTNLKRLVTDICHSIFSLLFVLEITEENFMKCSDIANGVKFHSA